MRIGVLTLPFNNNYGGYLQAYALVTVLKQMGHEPTLINRRFDKPNLVLKFRYIVASLYKSLFKLEFVPVYNREKIYYTKGEKMLKFVFSNIDSISEPVYSSDALKKDMSQGFDAYIVGSDQVWRPEMVPEIEDYFLRFVCKKGVKRIAYAASFGTSSPIYTLQQIVNCGKYISLFDSISLREESGLSVINKMGWKIHCCPSIVLDPTMLLDKEHYESVLNSNSDACNNIFCYVLDGNQINKAIIEYAVNLLNLKSYYVIDTEHWKDNNYIMPSIEDWLIGIRNSSFVITDSFHGTVFSIIFNKPFVVYANNVRGKDRFVTLLKYFSLDSRIVDNLSDVKTIVKDKIDWTIVNEKLKVLREYSISFLESSLAKN